MKMKPGVAQRKLDEIRNYINPERKKKKTHLPRDEKKTLSTECPVCLSEMDSMHCDINGSIMLGWFCVNDCKAGSQVKGVLKV